IASTLYSWYDDNTPISGATGAEYILQTGDLPMVSEGRLRAEAEYEDSLGFTETLPAALVLNGGGNVDGTGAVMISGTISFSAGEVYTAVTSGIRDANGEFDFAYQWQVSFDGGEPYADLSDETDSTYTIVLSHFAGAVADPPPRLRLSVLHTDRLGIGQTFLATMVHTDRPADGDLAITPAGLEAGDEVSSDALDVSDDDSDLEYAYQWQTEDTGNPGDFADIVNATLSAYTLDAADFAPAVSLRLMAVATDAFGGVYTVTSAVTLISEETTGGIFLTLLGGVPAVGATVSIIAAGIGDANGEGAVSYAWFLPGGQIGGAVDDSYILSADDLSAASRGLLRTELSYRDGLGFETTLSASIADTAKSIAQALAGGAVVAEISGLAFGTDSASVRIEGIADNFIAGVEYTWETGVGSEFAAPRNALPGDSYPLRPEDFNPQDSLRAIATVSGINGDSLTMTSAVMRINEPPTGEIIVTVEGGGEAVAGAVLGADLSGLRDVNGGLSVREHIWVYADITLRDGDARYTLSADAVRAGEVSYMCVCEDAAEFSAVVAANIRVGGVDAEQVEAVLAAVNAVAAGALWDALEGHFDSEDGLRANDAPIDDPSQIAETLSRRAEDSRRPDSPFALDSFALKQSGGEAGSEWSWWTRGALSRLEGNPQVGGTETRYEGHYSSFYAGMDRRWGEKIRGGIAFGADVADLDVEWSGGAGGRLEQRVRSFVPYAEWSPDADTSFRALASFGYGEVALENAGDVVKTDVRRHIVGLRARRRRDLDGPFDLVYSGGLDSVRTRTAAADFVGLDVPLKSGHRELHFNVETGYLTPLAEDGTWRKFLNLQWRSQSGDLDESSLYDLGAGFQVSLPAYALFLDVDGETQLTDADNERKQLGVRLAYGRGRLINSLETRYDASRLLLHRWKIDAVSEWRISEFHSGIYVERRGDDLGVGIGTS
ncbi:MAG: hypothetical protein ACR2QC_06115, partial [Gammaproteobacteria bacterium]